MKKTRVMISDLLDVNYNIERLEESGWEVVNFKDIKLSNGEVYILIMAQKEDDKSVYEKIYLLEKIVQQRVVVKGAKLKIYATANMKELELHIGILKM